MCLNGVMVVAVDEIWGGGKHTGLNSICPKSALLPADAMQTPWKDMHCVQLTISHRYVVVPAKSSCMRMTKAVKAGKKGNRCCPFTLSPPGSPMGPLPSNLPMAATCMPQTVQ